MPPRRAAPALPASPSVDDRKQPHSEESEDGDEEAESEEEEVSSPHPQQANNDEDDTSFTTMLFSDRGTVLPFWTVEKDDDFNKLIRERTPLSTLQPDDKLTVKQLQVIFDCYRKCIITNTLETYLIFLSWATHIHGIEDEDVRVAHSAALQDFIRDVEHISDKGDSKKGSLSAIGLRILVAAYIWLHSRVWKWWDEHRSRVSIKMIASCTVKAITDEFLLGRFMRVLMLNEHKAKAEVSQLAKDIVEEDGIAAWDIRAKTLTFHVFHCDKWVEATVQQAKERQWVKAETLRQQKRWTDICDKKEKAIRALTIVSIGTVAKKSGGVDTFEVQFSSKESLWLSHDNIRALNVKQWVDVLDAEDEASDEEEEKKDEAEEESQSTPEQQKVIKMEEKLKEEHRLRVQEHQLRVRVEKQLRLLQQERKKERMEQQRQQRLREREKAKETAQLLDRLGRLSQRMEGELREEVLQVIRALQGAALEQPAEEAKEAPQLPAAAAEETKERPESATASQEAESEDDAAEDDAAEGDAAENDAAENDASGDSAAEEDAAKASSPPLATGGKRKQAPGKAKGGKKQRP
jgi:hypothetical protein